MPVTGDLEAGAAAYAATLPDASTSSTSVSGPDGHTASLVPGDPVLEVRDREVAVTGPYQGHRRMTLTYPAIDRAREALWLVTGDDKRDALARCCAGDEIDPRRPRANGAAARPRRRRSRGRVARQRLGRVREPSSIRVAERGDDVAEHVDAQLEVLDRDALVGRVDQPRGELDVHRLEREEPVGGRPEGVPQPVAVREAGADDRRQPAPGSRRVTHVSSARQSGVSTGDDVPPA